MDRLPQVVEAKNKNNHATPLLLEDYCSILLFPPFLEFWSNEQILENFFVQTISPRIPQPAWPLALVINLDALMAELFIKREMCFHSRPESKVCWARLPTRGSLKCLWKCWIGKLHLFVPWNHTNQAESLSFWPCGDLPSSAFTSWDSE